MLNLLYRLVGIKSPLDNVSGRMCDTSLRLLQPKDIPVCLAIYRANEAAWFPPGLSADYERNLSDGNMLTLIAARGGVDVGCCSISFGPSYAWLSYGMVAPDHHTQGIGSALLLARIALLPSDRETTVVLTALPNSRPFFRRFGFYAGGTFGVGARPQTMMQLTIRADEVRDCRKLLAQRAVSYPDVTHIIPVASAQARN